MELFHPYMNSQDMVLYVFLLRHMVMEMVNGLHTTLFWSTDHSKHFYSTYLIHPFTYTFIHWWQRLPCKVPTAQKEHSLLPIQSAHSDTKLSPPLSLSIVTCIFVNMLGLIGIITWKIKQMSSLRQFCHPKILVGTCPFGPYANLRPCLQSSLRLMADLAASKSKRSS